MGKETRVLLQFSKVTKIHFATSGATIPTLQELDLYVKENEFTCVLGPSGCGKTTCLRLAAGLDFPTSGTVCFRGREIKGPGRERAMVFQEFTLFPWRNILANVSFGLELQGRCRKESERIAREYLTLVGLSGWEKLYPHELSGGMKQKVAIARALAADPDLLLMDEPFAALDEQTRQIMQNELLQIWEKQSKTVLFVTHSVEEAVFLADRVVVMTPRPAKVKEVVVIDLPRPRNRYTKGFIYYRAELSSLLEHSTEIGRQRALGG